MLCLNGFELYSRWVPLIDLKSSVWFTLGSEDETVFCDTFFSSTAGRGFQNTKWPAILYSQ